MRIMLGSLLMLAVLPFSVALAATAPEVEADKEPSSDAPVRVRPRRICQTGFSDVLRTGFDGITQPQFRIIDNLQDWCSFWDQVYSRSSSPPPCDTSAIDFSSEVAVVAALGDRPDTCYDVRIACINRRGDSIDVIAVETVPGFSCACGDAITQPLHVVKVRRPVASATFDLRRAVLRCP